MQGQMQGQDQGQMQGQNQQTMVNADAEQMQSQTSDNQNTNDNTNNNQNSNAGNAQNVNINSKGVRNAPSVIGGTVFPTAGLATPDADCDLPHVMGQAQHRTVEVALVNAFAFGGANCSLALRRCA